MARWTGVLVVLALVATNCFASACASSCPSTIEVRGRDYYLGCLPILDPRELGPEVQPGVRAIEGFDPNVIVAVRDACHGPATWTPADASVRANGDLYRRLPELDRIRHHEVPVTGWNPSIDGVSADTAAEFAREHPPGIRELGLRRLIRTTDLIVVGRLKQVYPSRWNQASGADWRYARKPGGVAPAVFTHVVVQSTELLDRRLVGVRGIPFHWPDRPRTPQPTGIEYRGRPRGLVGLEGAEVVLFLQVVPVPLVDKLRVASPVADIVNRTWLLEDGVAIPPTGRLRADVARMAPPGPGVAPAGILGLVARTCDRHELDGITYALALC